MRWLIFNLLAGEFCSRHDLRMDGGGCDRCHVALSKLTIRPTERRLLLKQPNSLTEASSTMASPSATEWPLPKKTPSAAHHHSSTVLAPSSVFSPVQLTPLPLS